MRKQMILASRLLFVLLLLGNTPFLCKASNQDEDPNASGLNSVPKSDPAYKDAAFLRSHDLLRGCPLNYFNGQRLLTRYEFALSIDRALKRLKTGLLDIPELFPYPYIDLTAVGGATLEEYKALKRLYTEFDTQLSILGDDPRACDQFFARLEEIAIRTSKISLTGLPDPPFGHRHQIDSYLRVAIALQAMGKEKACETLLTLARFPQSHEGMAPFILCRMLFTARGEAKFNSPGLGAPVFMGRTDFADWPLEPIEIVDGMPFLISRGYHYGGPPNPPGLYVKYCIQNCDWNKTLYTMKPAEEKQQALNKLLSSPKWKRPLDRLEKAFLAQQIEETKK